MKKRMFKRWSSLVMTLMMFASLFTQAVYAQQPGDGSIKISPRSSMRINMETSVDGQEEELDALQEFDVTVTWLESMAMAEPVKIAVTGETKILAEDASDIVFKTNGIQKDISDLTIEDGAVKFMTGKAESRSTCTLTYKVKAPLAAGEFNISTKIAAEKAPTTMANYVERTFKVASGLTVETTYDTIYGDLPFDVYGLVNYKTQVENPDLVLSLDVYNEETGEFVYEVTGAAYPEDNTYRIANNIFPDTCEDGNYVVHITLADGWNIIGTAQKTIKYVKSKEFTITVKDVIKEETSEDSQSVREFVYELGQTIETIQPKEIENTTVEGVAISPEENSGMQADENYNITGTMPIGNVEIVYTHEYKKGIVDGLVTDQSSNPLAGATIKAYTSTGIDGELGTYASEMTADASGKFSYTLKAGIYNFTIEKEGYVLLKIFHVEVRAEETVHLERCLVVTDVSGSGTVSGLVYSGYSQDTLSGVTVNFRPGWNNKTGELVAAGGTVQTDAEGKYTANLPYGNYTAEFVIEGYVTVYLNITCAVDFNISQNTYIHKVEIIKGHVTGMVTDKDSAAIGGAVIKAYISTGVDGELGTYLTEITAGATGEFDFALEEGLYNFVIEKEGYVALTVFSVKVSAGVTVRVDKSMIVVDVSGSGTVTGLVYNGYTQGTLAGVTVNFRPGWNNETGEIIAAGGTVQTDAGGKYTTELPYGNYTAEFVIEGYGKVYVNVICGVGINVVENTYIHKVEIVKGHVTGLVTDKDSVAIGGAVIKAYVSAGVDGELGTYLTEITADATGEFDFALEEGIYNFVIEKEGYVALNIFQVSVSAGATIRLDKSMIVTDIAGSGTVTGKVFDTYNGGVLSGVTVNLRPGWNNKTGALVEMETVIKTDAEGKYTVDLAYGNYTAEFVLEGYVTVYVNVICGTGINMQEDVRIQEVSFAKGYVNGLVTDQAASPISGAIVKVYRSTGVDGVLGEFVSEITADASGIFNATLKVGTYNFTVEKEGYILLNVFNVEIKSEETVYLEKSLIIEDIEGNGTVTGLVYNAFTGGALTGVTVNFRSGWNNKTGALVEAGTVQTDASGRYTIELPYGNYTAEFVMQGYVTVYVNVICASNYSTEQNATITPVLSADEYRVVLTWGASPSDLDSHLTGPAAGGSRFHVFYSNKSYTQSDGSVASLDVDDTSSYGPETITFKINPGVSGVYRYSIHDFSNKASTSSQALSLSGAQVKVYNGDTLKATFNVPTNQVGSVWEVFEVDNGVFKPVNTFYNESNSGNVRSLPEKMETK